MPLNLNGFRNFWGKKMGGMIGRLADDLSPVGLNQAQGLRKHFQSTRKVPLTQKWESYKNMSGQARSARDVAVGQGRAQPYGIGDYFSGRNVEDFASPGGSKPRFRGSEKTASWGQLSESVRKRRMAWRLGIPGAMMGGMVAQSAIGKNPLTDTVSAAGAAGTIGIGTSMLTRFGGKKGAFAALGILGVTGVNAVRRGNQMGPF